MTNLHLNRRSMFKYGLGGGAFLLMNELPTSGSLFAASNTAVRNTEPHFFLHLIVDAGLDASYLFDARPLAMTAAGLQSNYIGEEPTLYRGVNGNQTYITKLTKPLEPHLADLSILTGVHMAATFDGHEQNTNFFLTGNPFGGESFIPHLNEGLEKKPIDLVRDGYLYADVNNNDATIPMSPADARDLVNKLSRGPALTPKSKLFQFMQGRMTANGQGAGRFSAASKLMAESLLQGPTLEAKIRSMNLEDDGSDQTVNRLAAIFAFLRSGISRSGMLSINPTGSIDTHDIDSAKSLPATVADICDQLARIINYLKVTPYDDQRSLFDVTTLVVNSEFSRTMRQMNMPIDGTGTDHNPMTNTVIIAGKGIKRGLVIGSSDSQTPTETLSGAHKALDPEHLKIMGRPFDFRTMSSSSQLPETYRAGDYLSFSSIANTIYTLFGADPKHHWLVERNGKPAEILRGLLS